MTITFATSLERARTSTVDMPSPRQEIELGLLHRLSGQALRIWAINNNIRPQNRYVWM
jgi:hypothetical protein